MAGNSALTSPAAPDDADEPALKALPPRTPYEDAVAGILADLLGRPDVDLHDGLLALGVLAEAPRVVAQIRKTMGVEIPVADCIESRTVAGLAAAVAAKSLAQRSLPRPHALTRRTDAARPLLSFDQQRLWMENQLLPGVIYNVHGRRRVKGVLDVAVFEASIRAILARHETLRTRFPATDDGEPVQVVDEPDEGWRIRVKDLSGRHAPGSAQFEEAALALLDEELTTPFDLTTGPLIRCLLVRLGDEDHALAVTMHHIVSDAWSIGLFVRELTALYEAGGDPGRAGLTPPPVQYLDYAVWQRGWLTGDALEYQVSHWRRQLEGAPRALALPTAQRRTNAMRAEAGQVLDGLSPEETAGLHALCREHGVTPFMVLYTLLATLFSRWSGQSDLVIGVPVAGRNNTATDRLIGFFINMLPMRVDLSGDPVFTDLLARVRRDALDGYAHAEAPMDELVRDLNVLRDPRRTPLFEVVLNVVGLPEAEEVTTLAIEQMETPSLFSRYDLTLTVHVSEGRLGFKLDFPADRFDPTMARVLLGQLRTLLAAVVADPGVRVLEAPAEEPAAEPQEPDAAAAPHLSAARYRDEPGRVAVTDGAGRWSYGRLSRAADRVAEALAGHGVSAADRVGVVRRPNAGFVAVLTGAAAAGVPCSVIETDDPALTGPLGLTAVLDGSPAGTAAPGTLDLSVVLRAGGEDGDGDAVLDDAAAPDGPAGRHGFSGRDRVVVLSGRPGLLASAMDRSFDAGAVLVIPDRAFGDDISALTKWLRENGITVAYLDPPILRALTAQQPEPELPDLGCVVVDNAGDLLPHDVEAIRRLAPGCRFLSLYRVAADGRPLAEYDAPADLEVADSPLRLPLGTPAAGRGVELRRPNGRPAATGEAAELWQDGERVGAAARLLPGRCLEFIGVPGADPIVDPIQTVAALRDVPGVRDAVVIEQAAQGGGTELLGYVCGPDPQLGTLAAHNHLKARLPEYLMPRHLFVLDSLPRTPWGAYDLRALPRPAGDDLGEDDYLAPRTPMERELAAILEELLGIERVGVYDSFFELGGFSMLATRLVSRVRESFGVQLSVRDVFEAPTVDELAPLIVRTQGEQVDPAAFEALLAEIEQMAP